MYLLQSLQQRCVIVAVQRGLLAGAQQDAAFVLAQPADLNQNVQHRNAVAAASPLAVSVQEAFLEVDQLYHANRAQLEQQGL